MDKLTKGQILNLTELADERLAWLQDVIEGKTKKYQECGFCAVLKRANFPVNKKCELCPAYDKEEGTNCCENELDHTRYYLRFDPIAAIAQAHYNNLLPLIEAWKEKNKC